MVILALDTSTREGGMALARDGVIERSRTGDPNRTHGERLPGDIVALLADAGVPLSAIDLFAVSSGPGSFTSLRVGIATIQALALAGQRPVVPISTLDALASTAAEADRASGLVLAWMDGQRGEIFAALYDGGADEPAVVAGPTVGKADVVLSRWAPRLLGRAVRVVGDGVADTRGLLEARLGPQASLETPPPLAPIMARLAFRRRRAALPPHAVQPLYVRRPDAVLARERRDGPGGDSSGP